MHLFTTARTLQSAIQLIRLAKKSLGFVPTMGALHEGHITLINEALQQNDITVISIFVNPTQFDNTEDLEKYPRNLKDDLALLKKNSNKSRFFIFHPEVNEVYNHNPVAKQYDFKGLDQQMEGAFRPGHFDGVATIVEYLLRIVLPDRAYFGEKDFQQLQIVKNIVSDLSLPVRVIASPISRDPNGLARSSRNIRLSMAARERSGIFYRTLIAARESYTKNEPEEVVCEAIRAISDYPEIELEYFIIADEKTLKLLKNKTPNSHPRAFISARVEGIRLIDNMKLY